MIAMPSCAPKPAARQSGFTVIELMITVLIAAVLVGIALPSFRATIINSNVTQLTNALVHDLNIARSEAVRRGTLVAVISNSGGNDWSSGWYVETDGKFLADGTFTPPPVPGTDADVVLNTHPAVPTGGYQVVTGVTAVGGGPGIAPSVGRIIFNAQGNLIPLAQSHDINICRPDHKPTLSKRITVVASGMISTKTNTTGSTAPPCT